MDYHVFFESFDHAGASRWLNNSEIGLLVFGLVLVIGLVGEFSKPKAERWARLTDTFELLVILGVVGELFFDGLIFGFSGRLDEIRDISIIEANKVASNAYEVGNKARENAERLAVEVEVLRAKNDQYERENQIRQSEIDANQRSLNQGLTKTTTSLQAVEGRERTQEVDEGDIRRAMRGIKGSWRVVTLIRLQDPIAGPYADKIKIALERQTPRFKVYFEPLASSEFRGVIVCENSERDRIVGRALKTAGIVSEIKKITAKECQRTPEPAAAPSLTLGISIPLGPPAPPRHGTVIFVGHRRLPAQP